MDTKFVKLTKDKAEDAQEYLLRKGNTSHPFVVTVESLQARKAQLQAKIAEIETNISEMQKL